MKILDIIGKILMVIVNAVEFLAIPAFFFILGYINEFPILYYIITIGGYFLIAIIIQLICHLVFKVCKTKFRPPIIHMLENFFNRF